MALYIPHGIFRLARLLYVRPETFGPYYIPNVAYWSSVQLNSAALYAVPATMSNSNLLYILQCSVLVLLKLLLCGGYFCSMKIQRYS